MHLSAPTVPSKPAARIPLTSSYVESVSKRAACVHLCVCVLPCDCCRAHPCCDCVCHLCMPAALGACLADITELAHNPRRLSHHAAQAQAGRDAERVLSSPQHPGRRRHGQVVRRLSCVAVRDRGPRETATACEQMPRATAHRMRSRTACDREPRAIANGVRVSVACTRCLHATAATALGSAARPTPIRSVVVRLGCGSAADGTAAACRAAAGRAAAATVASTATAVIAAAGQHSTLLSANTLALHAVARTRPHRSLSCSSLS